mmetsp:Transcript_13879/g.38387  ORF Transcript_13879/g.38387 Transcript_13879/m.38387 type:complete len:306 (+) Transcript_13879:103-1020(+)
MAVSCAGRFAFALFFLSLYSSVLSHAVSPTTTISQRDDETPARHRAHNLSRNRAVPTSPGQEDYTRIAKKTRSNQAVTALPVNNDVKKQDHLAAMLRPRYLQDRGGSRSSRSRYFSANNGYYLNNNFRLDSDVDCDLDDRACQVKLLAFALLSLILACLCCCCFRSCCFWCCGGVASAIAGICCLGGQRHHRHFRTTRTTTTTTRRERNSNDASYQSQHYHYHTQQQQQQHSQAPRQQIALVPSAPYEELDESRTVANNMDMNLPPPVVPYETVIPIAAAIPAPSAPYEEGPPNDSTPLLHHSNK